MRPALCMSAAHHYFARFAYESSLEAGRTRIQSSALCESLGLAPDERVGTSAGGMRRVAAAAGHAALGRAAEPDRLPHLRHRLLHAAARAAAGGCHLLWRPPHARQLRSEGAPTSRSGIPTPM